MGGELGFHLQHLTVRGMLGLFALAGDNDTPGLQEVTEGQVALPGTGTACPTPHLTLPAGGGGSALPWDPTLAQQSQPRVTATAPKCPGSPSSGTSAAWD